MAVSAPFIYYSVETRRELAEQVFDAKPATAPHRRELGLAHYTYRIVARRFIAMLAANGVGAKEVDRPEMYDTSTVPGASAAGARPIHLIFKPTEEIRVLRGAYNIGVVYWEFDKITTEAASPVSNQFRMLNLLDEIWVANTYLRDNLERAGFRNVHIIPCPIDNGDPNARALSLRDTAGNIDSIIFQFDRRSPPVVPLRESLPAGAGGEARPVFLSVLNPQDERKDIDALIRGFLAVAVTPERSPILLVKLIFDRRTTGLSDMQAAVAGRLHNLSASGSQNIIFIAEALAESEMMNLYRSCQYYISVSRAEGQNLPLIEAINCGCIAVAPNHTSMADYINPDTAIVIPAVRKRADPWSNAFGSTEFFWYQCQPADIVRCIDTAMRLTPGERGRIARNARQTTARRFAPAAIWPLVAARLGALT